VFYNVTYFYTSTGKETLNGIFVRAFKIDAEKRNICSCKSEVG